MKAEKLAHIKACHSCPFFAGFIPMPREKFSSRCLGALADAAPVSQARNAPVLDDAFMERPRSACPRGLWAKRIMDDGKRVRLDAADIGPVEDSAWDAESAIKASEQREARKAAVLAILAQMTQAEAEAALEALVADHRLEPTLADEIAAAKEAEAEAALEVLVADHRLEPTLADEIAAAKEKGISR